MLPLLLLTPVLLQDAADASLPITGGFDRSLAEVPVGRVYHYEKSNVDGSNASHVDLYVAAEDRIESFKWHEGASEATLVIADLDWTTFSVRRFQTKKLFADGTVVDVADLTTTGARLEGVVGPLTFEVPVERFPWHSHDFDLASLNLSLRFLEDPEGAVEFGVMDVIREPDGMRFGSKGAVELAFEEREERGGVPCRRYSIDGPGLEDRGGLVWVRLGEDPVIVDYEIDLPDEPGMESGKMRLLGTEELTAEAWAALRKQRMR